METVFQGKSLPLLLRNLSLGLQVAFGPYQHFAYILAGIGLDLFKPTIYAFEGHQTVYCVSQDYACRPLVISLRDGPESLLPSSIPNLQFHSRPIDVQHLYLKVYPNGCYITLSEFSLTKSCQEVGLTHSTISYYYDLQNLYLLLVFFGYDHSFQIQLFKINLSHYSTLYQLPITYLLFTNYLSIIYYLLILLTIHLLIICLLMFTYSVKNQFQFKQIHFCFVLFCILIFKYHQSSAPLLLQCLFIL